MTFPPTAEQQAIVDAYLPGDNLTIEAGAGAGKTSTLRLLGEATPRRRGLYFAYNKAIASDAARSFSRNVECRTAHSLAYRAVGFRYRDRLNAPRVTGMQTARLLGINEPLRVSADRVLAQPQIARIVMETVARFCYSADEQPTWRHVPPVNGADDPQARRILTDRVAPLAGEAWADLTRLDGRLRYTHDVYLKTWALSNPTIDADFIMLDEAQDANGVVVGVMARQQAQKITVGDANQAIYGWRGASDAMGAFDGRRLRLTQSFRFGPAIADEANKWLDLLDSDLRITGTATIPSTLGPLDHADAVLCRTNAEAMSTVIGCHKTGVPVALVGGGQDVRKFAEAANELREKGTTWHPELCAFTSWGQVVDYCEHDAGGEDFKVFVKLIDEHGADEVIDAIDRTVPERAARVVASTAHKAKGREWATVRIADDFDEPDRDNDERPARDDLMLAYVSVTRARQVLDRGGLAWVDKWLGMPTAAERSVTVPVDALCGVACAYYEGVTCELAPHDPDTDHHAAGIGEWADTRQAVGVAL